jgi:hypothetical protein
VPPDERPVLIPPDPQPPVRDQRRGHDCGGPGPRRRRRPSLSSVTRREG